MWLLGTRQDTQRNSKGFASDGLCRFSRIFGSTLLCNNPVIDVVRHVYHMYGPVGDMLPLYSAVYASACSLIEAV